MAEDYEFGATMGSIASQQISIMISSFSQLSRFNELQKFKSLSRKPRAPTLSTEHHPTLAYNGGTPPADGLLARVPEVWGPYDDSKI